jgi:MFS family permease
MSLRAWTVGGRWTSTFSALRSPNYRKWFAGQTVSLMGTWMQWVAQGWLVYELTGSKLALGTVSFAGSIPTLFLMLPAGVLMDRVSNRRLLMVTQSLMLLLALALTFLTASGRLEVWMIAAIAFMVGVVNSFDAPARLSLPVQLVEDRADLQNAIALNATMFNLARVIGPAIGGVALAALGAAWCFGLNSLSFLAVIVALAAMTLPNTARPRARESLIVQLREGLRYVWHTPTVRNIILLMTVSSLFAMSYGVVLPAYAADILHVGEAGLGALNAAVGAGALIGALSAAALSRNPNKGMQVTVGSLIFPTALLCLAFTRTFPVALICLAFAGFGVVTQNAVSNTLVQSMVPDALRGRVTSIYSLTFFGPMPFGALMAGALAQRLGTTTAVAICAGVTLAFALGLFVRAPNLRHAQVAVA